MKRIHDIQAKLVDLFNQEKDAVKELPKPALQEIQHLADETRMNRSHLWSVRTAAEIVYAATTLTLENLDKKHERKQPSNSGQ